MNKIRIAGAAAGVVLVSGMVLQVSSAAFTGETSNTDNSWAAGTVTLTDDDTGVALYASQADIVPGYSEIRCIEVSYTGSVATTALQLHAAVTSTGSPGTDNGLSDDLDVQVSMGPLASECNIGDDGFVDAATGLLPQVGTSEYDGTLAAFNAAGSPMTTGWTPDGATNTDLMRPFLFTVTLGADTGNDAQGDSATADFTWTATS